MAASISFNGQAITDKLDVFIKSELPWIATLTLNGKYGRDLSLAGQVQEDLRLHMQTTFSHVGRETEKFWVEKSKKRNLVTTISHKDEAPKGTPPSEYLKPQILGGDVYPTRFQRRLRARGFLGNTQGDYMLPIKGGQVGWGRMSRGEYVKAGWGISAFEDLRLSGKYGKTNYRTAGTYVWVPRNLHDLASGGISQELTQKAGMIRGLNKGKLPPSGIYRVNKKSLTKVFQMLDDLPNYERKYQFRPVAKKSLDTNYQRIFRQEASKFSR